MTRHYRLVKPPELRVTLLQGADRLLPEMHPALGKAALASLRKRGVDVRLNTRASEIRCDGMMVADGTWLASETVVGTVGTQPNSLLASLGLPLDRGRPRVTPVLHVEGSDRIWAVGDCACVWDGETSHPATAQVAVQQGHQLAANIAAALAGAPLAPFRYRHRGSMAAMGHLNGVAEVGG